jgi:transposase
MSPARVGENRKGRSLARQRRHFTQEYKDEIVRMVLDGPRPIAHVAREVGIHDTTLGNWVKDYRRRHGGDASAGNAGGEKKSARELELERENRKLREENAFLVKAAAFFAKDHR